MRIAHEGSRSSEAETSSRTDDGLRRGSVETARHRTSWLEAGPERAPLMVFLHGWPELGLIWRSQLRHFSAEGWRCVAPDMRGYGNSSRPHSISAYSVRELVADMVELHDALGASPAIWIGHDWGSAVAWAIASHHAERCRGVVNLCVPYFARGFALPNLLPLVDRDIYPSDRYPAGQWDYWLYYREHFGRASQAFEADVAATLSRLYRTAPARVTGTQAATASIRDRGGWFSSVGDAVASSKYKALLDERDFDSLVRAFSKTGFGGADAWYMNDAENMAYAAEAPDFGRINLPALFIHAANDTVCDTTRSRMAEPMRDDCSSLSEVIVEGGHEIMLERPEAVNEEIAAWLISNGLPLRFPGP
jgi:pimeloyl-ACP methyl ester carboxylesterase